VLPPGKLNHLNAIYYVYTVYHLKKHSCHGLVCQTNAPDQQCLYFTTNGRNY